MNDVFAFLPLLLVAGIAAVVLRYVLRARQHRITSNRSSVPPSTGEAAGSAHGYRWPSIGEFDFEIVGESHYQRVLARLSGPHGTEGAEAQCVADLVPEDSNPHDQKAVAVLVQGETVGYFSREDARSFRRRLGNKGLSGTVTTCDAVIVGGGTRRNGEKLYYGVKLDIKPFD